MGGCLPQLLSLLGARAIPVDCSATMKDSGPNPESTQLVLAKQTSGRAGLSTVEGYAHIYTCACRQSQMSVAELQVRLWLDSKVLLGSCVMGCSVLDSSSALAGGRVRHLTAVGAWSTHWVIAQTKICMEKCQWLPRIWAEPGNRGPPSKHRPQCRSQDRL